MINIAGPNSSGPLRKRRLPPLLVVDDEFVGRQRVRERHVTEQVALAEELDAIALVVVSVERSFRSRRLRRASLSAGPVSFVLCLLRRVAEDESTAALGVLPLRGPVLAELRLFLSSDLPHVRRPPQPYDFLLYPTKKIYDGRGPEGQQMLAIHAYPKKRPSPQAVHRWWYRQLQSAGLVGRGITHGLNMHLARHTFATELRRVVGIDAASQALGHADLNTMLGIYGHRDQTDLETAMDAYTSWLEQQREDEIVPPEADR